MKRPMVNLEETFGKIVGKNISGAADYDRLVDAAEQLMPALPFPKGVYRFRSFEEADRWTQHHILKAARKKNRARLEATKDAPDRAFLRDLLNLQNERAEETDSPSILKRLGRWFAK
jgi:hypothetical protein